MRLFDVYSFNLKNIRFKDNIDYFNESLKALGLEFTDVGFCFHCGEDHDKVVKASKNLSEYRIETTATVHEEGFSSFSVDDNGKINVHIKREHISDLASLTKKIPRPINYGFMGVLLDNIRWDDSYNSSPCFNPTFSKDVILHDHTFFSYYSNSIRFIKEFDYGNKLNLVKVVVERNADFDRISPLPQKFIDFCANLGKPFSKNTVFVFEEEENGKWTTAKNEIKQLISKREYYGLFDEFKRDYPDTPGGEIQKAIESITPVQGFSPKKIFTGIGKKHGFRYDKCVGGCYELKRVNEHHYSTKVSFYMKPLSANFFAEVSMQGYNFDFIFTNFPEAILDSELIMERYAKKVFEIAEEVEKKYCDTLFNYYGKTPSWYEA